jgi:methylmalonyl-CoA mutase
VIDQEQLLMDVDIDVYTSTTKSSVHEEITPPLTPYRGAKNFESIRLKSEQYGLVKGSTPKVYLMQIGAINKNASLAFNLFAVGGYNIKRSPIFRDVDNAIAEAKNEQADIVIISTDPNDKDIMEKCLAELNGSTSLVVAGKAEPETIKEMKSKGIVTFIHEHTDVINVLKYFHQEFGIM